MADEEPDKESQTEEATEKRIRTALEEGNVPFSREASIFASVAAALLVAAFVLKDVKGDDFDHIQAQHADGVEVTVRR